MSVPRSRQGGLRRRPQIGLDRYESPRPKPTPFEEWKAAQVVAYEACERAFPPGTTVVYEHAGCERVVRVIRGHQDVIWVLPKGGTRTEPYRLNADRVTRVV